jgi:hypothetical protein
MMKSRMCSSCWKHLQQADDAAADQMNAGRFQGFDETARESHGDTVLQPRAPPLARLELDDARIGENLAFDIREQRLSGLLVANVTTAVDHAVADAMLQRNAPLPAGVTCDRACVRNGFADGLGL